VSFARIQDGSIGLPGSRGSITAARAITGSGWSDLEAVEALRDYGLSEPVAAIAGDVVTLHNLSVRFVQTRRYSGSGWVLQAPSIPGTNILPGTVATESLLVTGMAEAMNADPNTQDITAWSGSGIQIVSDTTAPNGTSALQMQGQGVTVLGRQFPVNEEDNYQVRCWVKDHGGTGSTMFLLVAFYDASGSLIQGTAAPAGWDDTGTHHYYGLVNEAPSSSWVEHSVSFGSDEPFKVPPGARTARLGAISNFLSAGVQRISGLLCRRKVDGRVVVDGSLAARHVDSRGLTIRNEQGQVLLQAGGASTPPWLVLVESTQEPGALSLANPPDTSNRATVRGLMVDGVELSARYSPTGRSVEISAASTEVWRVVYASPMPVFIADGLSVMDRSQFVMQPNTAYRLCYRVFPRSLGATPGTMAISLELPAGCSYQLSNGDEVENHPGGPISVGTYTAPTSVPNIFENTFTQSVPTSPATTVTVPNIFKGVLIQALVFSGPGGGVASLRASSAGQNTSLYKGSEFCAYRIKNYLVPEVAVETSAVMSTAGAVGRFGSSDFQAATGQSYQATQTINYVRPPNSSSPFVGGLFGLTVRRQLGTTKLLLVTYAQNITGPGSGSASLTMVNANVVTGQLLVGGCEFLSPVPASESPRWTFDFRCTVVSYSEAGGPSDTTEKNYQVNESVQIDPNNLAASAGDYWDAARSYFVAVGPGVAVVDIGVKAFFMGQQVGSEQVVRFTTNIQ